MWVNMVGGLFNGFRIGSDIILECGFGPNSTPKASSKDEGCPLLIYYILTLYLRLIIPSKNKCPNPHSKTNNTLKK